MIRGASPHLVRRGIDERDSLPGTCGFAGQLPDGRLVRDVLGREPLFVERTNDGDSEREDIEWAFSPTDLDDPAAFLAGHIGGTDDARRVWTLPEPPTFDTEAGAVDTVTTALRDTLGATGGEDLAVAFSGGVDSAVVASAFEVPLFVVGFPDSHDIAAAHESARAMGRDGDLRMVECTHDDIEHAIPEIVRATGRTNAMDVGIALPLFLVAQRVATEGYDRLAVGQGADELFGGYQKVASPDHRVEADSIRGAARETIAGLPDQLERDAPAVRAAGVEPVTPLLDDRVVRVALRLDGSMLATETERKRVFRRAAKEFVPPSVASHKKKAAQYGSLIARELDRLARQAGFKRRMDDHVDRYIASLLE